MAPLDQIIATWRVFLQARVAYQRLAKLLDEIPAKIVPMPLPAPQGEVSLEKAVITPPGAVAPIIKGISLIIEAGTQLAIIGPSAAGKSTLARAILGLYQPASGSVRLDGAEIEQWDREQLGRYIGYLPQDVELLEGSISENIARFGDIDPDQVVAAAQAAGIHDMVLHLPEGYDSKIVGNGNVLWPDSGSDWGWPVPCMAIPRLFCLTNPIPISTKPVIRLCLIPWPTSKNKDGPSLLLPIVAMCSAGSIRYCCW